MAKTSTKTGRPLAIMAALTAALVVSFGSDEKGMKANIEFAQALYDDLKAKVEAADLPTALTIAAGLVVSIGADLSALVKVTLSTLEKVKAGV